MHIARRLHIRTVEDACPYRMGRIYDVSRTIGKAKCSIQRLLFGERYVFPQREKVEVRGSLKNLAVTLLR